jgi:hypothetical protein
VWGYVTRKVKVDHFGIATYPNYIFDGASGDDEAAWGI